MRRLLVAVVAGALLLGACSTDDAPDPAPEPTPTPATTGDAAVDAVLALLAKAPTATFTATYHYLRRLGPFEGDATVVQLPPRSAVTVGDVVVLGGGDEQTCALIAGTCTPGRAEQRLSDSVVTSTFWAAGPEAALRAAAARATAPAQATTEVVAGQQATCATVPTASRRDTYCATDLGPVARVDSFQIEVALVALQPTADAAAVQAPKGPLG